MTTRVPSNTQSDIHSFLEHFNNVLKNDPSNSSVISDHRSAKQPSEGIPSQMEFSQLQKQYTDSIQANSRLMAEHATMKQRLMQSEDTNTRLRQALLKCKDIVENKLKSSVSTIEQLEKQVREWRDTCETLQSHNEGLEKEVLRLRKDNEHNGVSEAKKTEDFVGDLLENHNNVLTSQSLGKLQALDRTIVEKCDGYTIKQWRDVIWEISENRQEYETHNSVNRRSQDWTMEDSGPQSEVEEQLSEDLAEEWQSYSPELIAGTDTGRKLQSILQESKKHINRKQRQRSSTQVPSYLVRKRVKSSSKQQRRREERRSESPAEMTATATYTSPARKKLMKLNLKNIKKVSKAKAEPHFRKSVGRSKSKRPVTASFPSGQRSRKVLRKKKSLSNLFHSRR